jgi:hypothetical protein
MSCSLLNYRSIQSVVSAACDVARNMDNFRAWEEMNILLNLDGLILETVCVFNGFKAPIAVYLKINNLYLRIYQK